MPPLIGARPPTGNPGSATALLGNSVIAHTLTVQMLVNSLLGNSVETNSSRINSILDSNETNYSISYNFHVVTNYGILTLKTVFFYFPILPKRST